MRAARHARRHEGAASAAARSHRRHMPRATGFELIDQVRADPRFATLPIVMISGDSDPNVASRALSRGASAFFAKPYSPAAIRRKLEQLVC